MTEAGLICAAAVCGPRAIVSIALLIAGEVKTPADRAFALLYAVASASGLAAVIAVLVRGVS